MKILLRPTLQKYLYGNRQVFLLTGFLLSLAIFITHWSARFFFGGIGGLFTILLLISFYDFIRSRLEIDEEQICGWIPRNSIQIRWDAIQAVNTVSSRNKEFIFLGTGQENYYIPLAFFDNEELWSIIKQKVNPFVFEEEAHRKTQELFEKDLIAQTVRVGVDQKINIISFLSLLLAGLMVYSYWKQGDIRPGLVIGLMFASMGGFLFISSLAYILADRNSVKLSIFYGRFKIQWSEIVTIEMMSGQFAFIGSNKRLVISLGFADTNRNRLLLKIFAHASQQNIPIYQKTRTPWMHKNTRLPKGESF